MKGTQGYSLLEVLISFAILSLVLAVLLPSLSQNHERLVTASERALALDYAQSRMSALGVSRKVSVGEFEGIYADRWAWSETIFPHSDGTDGLVEVAVEIFTLRDMHSVARLVELKRIVHASN